MGSVTPTELELIMDRFMLWDVLMVACVGPMRSKRSVVLEAAGMGCGWEAANKSVLCCETAYILVGGAAGADPV